MEYADVISHFIVIITYANNLEEAKWNSTVKAYFAFYTINLIVWVFPLLIVCSASDENIIVPPYHGMIVDIITDIPMFITTVAKRAYIGNIYICFDIAVKFIVFIRGVIWVPYQVNHETQSGFCTAELASRGLVTVIIPRWILFFSFLYIV